jgi:hypothetical protein
MPEPFDASGLKHIGAITIDLPGEYTVNDAMDLLHRGVLDLRKKHVTRGGGITTVSAGDGFLLLTLYAPKED